ncbi:MAG: NAD-dependent epimerase/dehydratase family protein [Candidatus Krumholzibacteriia bacterium]
MKLTRRDVLRHGTALAAAAGVVGPLGARRLLAQPGRYRPERAEHPLQLLILGGTAFLGPHTVDAARARGHEVTLFNRGRTNPELFPDLEKLHGDRDDDLDALRNRRWDVVIDNSGYVPRHVRLSAELLAPAVDHYIFISTISVYADFDPPYLDETYPVGTLEDEGVEEVTGTTYGPLKALCERAAETAMPGRTTVVRPGLIVGPLDRSDRFTYWPARVHRGGEVLAPGDGTDFTQFIDVRDLAEFIVHCAEQRPGGIYNADAPPDSLTMHQFLETCRTAIAGDARLTWVDADFLAEHEVAPWSQMPVWLPPGLEPAMGRISTARARRAGLGRRPLEATIRDTLAWWLTEPEERRARPRAGITAEREAELLAAWHARRSG